MSVVLTILGWLLIVSLALLLAVLVTPFRVELMVTKKETWHYRAVWRLFGRFGPRVAIFGRKMAVKETPKQTQHREVKSKRPADPIRSARAFVRLGSDVLRRIKIDAARLDLCFGTGDPAETGRVFGMLTPLIYGSAASPRMALKVEPDFDQTILKGRAELDLSIVPARLLVPAARFGWSAFGPSR
jgi:hypothetical protein